MNNAVQIAVAGAKLHGVCVGGLHGIASTTGAIGFWAREIARSGLVGVVCSQSPELVAPYGTSQALLGTNPIAFGFPRTSSSGVTSSVVIDVATSAIAFYSVVAAKATGDSLPPGCAIDASGAPTTNPHDVAPPSGGALLPFGGALGSHKGSALSLAIELLAVLAGGAGTDKWQAENWGNLVIAIDPARFAGSSSRAFAERVNEVSMRIERAAPTTYGTHEVPRVFLPGQRGDELEAACFRDGVVPIAAPVWEALQQAVRETGSSNSSVLSSDVPRL
jgi:LDH2 family malate/lactate/ureidoglycolate dehydrogenase